MRDYVNAFLGSLQQFLLLVIGAISGVLVVHQQPDQFMAYSDHDLVLMGQCLIFLWALLVLFEYVSPAAVWSFFIRAFSRFKIN